MSAEVERRGGAMLTAPNFSLGVAVFDRVVAEAARLFAQRRGFRRASRRDASRGEEGRAVGNGGALARTAEAALGRAIPITSIRTGSVPGTHEIIFDAPFEQVRLVHEARDRRVFAEGALVAARWLVGRRGVFTMRDVLSSDRGGAS